MQQVFSKALSFIKENLIILYSISLFILIPAAFFINNYIINSSYEKNIDLITQRKAVLAENIIKNMVQNQISDTAALQSSVNRIMQENGDIILLSILKPQNAQEEFEIIASSDPNLINQKPKDQIQNLLAWNKPEGIAFLDRNTDGRFWKVTKSFSDILNQKIGLIEISFSLKDSDALIEKTIYKSNIILILTILVVVLLVTNQARLIGYVWTTSKLKEIDKMKDVFISMASHELRSPLTAIKGYVDLFQTKKDLTLDQDANHYLKNISLSVERLDNLIEDILEVSQIEGNRLPIEMSVFNPAVIVSQSIEEMRSQAIQKNLVLSSNLFQTPVQIKADENRLKQILINLISNAIKYTKKGSVEVATDIKKDKFLITVADSGIGISAEDQINLFQKFYRIKNKETEDIIGTGLGLWISNEIIKRMRGKITVESIKGVGSHFTIHIPIVKK